MEILQDFYDFFSICWLLLTISKSFLMIWLVSMPMARPGFFTTREHCRAQILTIWSRQHAHEQAYKFCRLAQNFLNRPGLAATPFVPFVSRGPGATPGGLAQLGEQCDKSHAAFGCGPCTSYASIQIGLSTPDRACQANPRRCPSSC